MKPDGAMAREIESQPAVLEAVRRRLLEPGALEALRRGVERVWFVGCGDMRFAAEGAADLAATAWGAPCQARSSMDLRWWDRVLRPQDLVVAASISGRTPRTREALERARRAGARTLAVTDHADSPLARSAQDVWVLATAPDSGGDYPGYAAEVPQTRTYLAVLLVFLAIAERFARRPPPPWQGSLEEELRRGLGTLYRVAEDHVAALTAGAVREVVLLGSGPLAASARYGAAKLLEFAIPARAQCIEEFHHLEVFVAGHGTWLGVLLGDAAATRRWDELRGTHHVLGVHSVEWRFPEDPARPGSPRALFDAALALQWQALLLAQALGRDVERWVGGVRRDAILKLSRRTIRESRVDLDA